MDPELKNLSPEDISKVFRSALAAGLVRPEDTAVIFFDLDFMDRRIRHLAASFPAGTLHALAIKANPLLKVLRHARNTDPSTGVEAASLGEVKLALKAGFEPSTIVFDSPVKTRDELEEALGLGIHLNIDNLSELERVADILKGNIPAGTVGIRINPQVGTGTIAESSVAGEYSKFGVPIRWDHRLILQAFLRYPWLTGVHLHVGSQGCSLGMLTEGTGILYDLVTEIDRERLLRGMIPVKQFDIGGGVPVSYHPGQEPFTMRDYIKALSERCPGLFRPVNPSPGSPQVLPPRLITEYGRWVFTNPGWTVSRVEYVKHDPHVNTAMIHVGADLFVRECLNPTDWKHRYAVLDGRGAVKTGLSDKPWNLAGPLCFSGDILARNVPLPEIREGDYAVVLDTGGYTFSMWSRYNSRLMPRIIGYSDAGFIILKERETQEDLDRFWE